MFGQGFPGLRLLPHRRRAKYTPRRMTAPPRILLIVRPSPRSTTPEATPTSVIRPLLKTATEGLTDALRGHREHVRRVFSDCLTSCPRHNLLPIASVRYGYKDYAHQLEEEGPLPDPFSRLRLVSSLIETVPLSHKPERRDPGRQDGN